jgi:transcriptional regulator with XRE-family HTH domain
MLITPEQIRAARALLRLDQATVAHDAGISIVTISVVTMRRLEADDGLSRVAPATVDEVRKALEKTGIEFIDSRRSPQHRKAAGHRGDQAGGQPHRDAQRGDSAPASAAHD